MSEKNTPENSTPEPDHSSNRWESTDAQTNASNQEPAGYEPGTPAASEASIRPSRIPGTPRARAIGAGVAALVLLVGGVGGFAVGRATAGDDDWDGPGNHQQVGFPPGGDGFHGDRDGDDGPGFGEGDDDGDDDRDGSDT